ncbi:MAG TPA: hypothetical protein VHC71_02505 [Hyphomicrobium sp.]|nr:hypothetical protein [Hyphomicrobium sp.]
MPLLLDSKGESIEGILAAFERLGVLSERTEIVLSVGAYRGAGGKFVPTAAASAVSAGRETISIPVASFDGYRASLDDGTPAPDIGISALDGAKILPDGSVALGRQAGSNDGLTLKDVRLRKSRPSYRWSEFDSYVLELALEGLPYKIFREYAPGILSGAALDFARVSAVKIERLDDLLNRLEKRLKSIWAQDLTDNGREVFKKWQGRASLRQAIARTLRESGLRRAREPGYGRCTSSWRNELAS